MKRRTFLQASASAAGLEFAGGLPQLAAATRGPESLPHYVVLGRERLDDGWKFYRGEIVPRPPHTGDATYGSTKAGAAAGSASPKFDDRGWSVVDLPHDFVVEGPFSETENVGQGYRPKGVAWYRRTIHFDHADQGKALELQFDGIATNATIWFNGNVVCHNWSAYNSAYIDLTPFARSGDEPNVIAVRVDSSPLQGWWYEGGGIYRHVWLVHRSPTHIVTDGVFAHPRVRADDIWEVPVEVTLAHIGEAVSAATVSVRVLDPDGSAVAGGQTGVRVDPLDRAIARVPLTVTAPRRWSIERPVLYRVETRVTIDGKVADRVVTSAGFRTQRFDPAHGFFLNEQPIKIKGVCVHQDHAGLGVTLPDSIIEFRLRRLKELGCNAIRSSHNAPTRELLDAADRLGLLIMDENRLFNPSPDYMAMLEWMVRRDRNHPSVILWSVFNEEPLQGTAEGYEMVRRMAAAVKALDTTRPVTAAMNSGMFNPRNVSHAVDVVGFNYEIDQYDKYHAAFPDKPMKSLRHRWRRNSIEEDPADVVAPQYPVRNGVQCSDPGFAWRSTGCAGRHDVALRLAVGSVRRWRVRRRVRVAPERKGAALCAHRCRGCVSFRSCR